MAVFYKSELVELLELVEAKYGRTLKTSTDFEEFTLAIKNHIGENVSASTLKRLWGYVNDRHVPRVHTLDILANYVGYASFKEFCKWLKTSSKYNSSFFSANQIHSKDMEIGQLLEIGWSPNRYIKLRYEGNSQFVVEEARESKLIKGDHFPVNTFFVGHPLYLPYIIRNEEKTQPFIAGRNGGLTILNRISNEQQ